MFWVLEIWLVILDLFESKIGNGRVVLIFCIRWNVNLVILKLCIKCLFKKVVFNKFVRWIVKNVFLVGLMREFFGG